MDYEFLNIQYADIRVGINYHFCEYEQDSRI